MLNELEQKIRKAIPELMELGVGCALKPKGCNFITLERKYNKQDLPLLIYDLTKVEYSEDDIEIIGKPIQLNHVLIYLNKCSHSRSRGDTMYIINNWNLKSNLLSDQSEELITFVNELKND